MSAPGYRSKQIPIRGADFGAQYSLTVHEFGPTEGETCYIQASLHADELPGMLVVHHLVKMLDDAEGQNAIKKRIQIVPYANPIGLSQLLLGKHVGRFNFNSGVNFNRKYIDMTSKIIKAKTLEGRLKKEDIAHNTALIRSALSAELEEMKKDPCIKTEEALKLELLSMACTCIVGFRGLYLYARRSFVYSTEWSI